MLLKSTNDRADRASLKDIFRKNSLEILRAASPYRRYKSSKIITNRLIKILKPIKPKTLMLYLPMDIEADISKLFKVFKKDTKIYVPFMECVSFKLVKYRLPVYKRKFNIKEPSDSTAAARRIDVAIVPVIGVDGDFRRVGFGRGMYDRFFASLRPKPLTIFVQTEKCFTDKRLCEEYDVQADIYITPTDIMIRRGKADVFRIGDRRPLCGSHRSGRFCDS